MSTGFPPFRPYIDRGQRLLAGPSGVPPSGRTVWLVRALHAISCFLCVGSSSLVSVFIFGHDRVATRDDVDLRLDATSTQQSVPAVVEPEK